MVPFREGENARCLSPVASNLFRLLSGLTLLAVLWKAPGYLSLFPVYRETPLVDDFFPYWLSHPSTLALAYLGTVLSLAVNMIHLPRRLLFSSSAVGFAALLILCLHQGAYNDVTFYTAAWNLLWSIWFLRRCRVDSTATLLIKGSWLAHGVLALILLGGAAGKWTSAYWSGQVLYEIYFAERDFWFFNLLRRWCDDSTLRLLACWYSRIVIGMESGMCVALLAFPGRWSAWGAVILFASIALFSNWMLFSVVLSPIALALVSVYRHRYLTDRGEDPASAENGDCSRARGFLPVLRYAR